MVDFLSSWVKNLSLALIIVSILEMILPNSKTKKYIKMIMGLYILFSIISPFIENSDKFNINELDFDYYTEEVSSISSEVDQTSMDNRLNEIYKEELQKDIIQKLEEKGYEVESCKVKAQISEEDSGIEKITLVIAEKIENEENNENTLENKIVTEIQKIQKVEIGNSDNKDDEDNQEIENSKITKTDIRIIKDFLISEYGVSENCLKIN